MQDPENKEESPAYRILIADDHMMVLDLISMAISASNDIHVDTAEDVAGALAKIESESPYDLILLDVNMPGMHGLQGLEQVQQASPESYVGIITGDPSPQVVMAVKRAGAAGVISKKLSMRSLSNTIRFMAMGERYFPLDLLHQEGEVKPPAQSLLSDREFSVLRKLADGLPNRDIGELLSLAEPTVKMHVQSIYKKLGVNNRTQAVIAARDLKLV